MKTITHNHKSLRQTALCLMVAFAIALPGVSQATANKTPILQIRNNQ